MSEEKLQKEFEVYQELGKQDKKIDVASLMINALQQHEVNLTNPRLKRWAYFVSLVIPPFGLLFALKFYFSDKDDAKQSAAMCVALTVVSLLLTILFTKALISGSGVDLNQVRQIDPAEIRSLYE